MSKFVWPAKNKKNWQAISFSISSPAHLCILCPLGPRGGGGVTHQSLVWGGSAPRFQPFLFIIIEMAVILLQFVISESLRLTP